MNGNFREAVLVRCVCSNEQNLHKIFHIKIFLTQKLLK